MAQKTKISWTDFSWNPVRGCSRVSEGCRHCYAEQIAARFNGPGKPFEGLAKRVNGEARWTGEVKLVSAMLDWPLKTRRSAENFRAKHGRKPRVFVNSMSDLFHEKLANEEIAAVFGVMAAAPWYTFQVLTKRPERAREWFAWVVSRPDNLTGGNRFPREVCSGGEIGLGLCRRELDLEVELGSRRPWPLPNVWLGTSVEDQATADARILHLLRCPAAVHWVSYEPALSGVNFSPYVGGRTFRCSCGFHETEAELVFTGGDNYRCAECSGRCEILPGVALIVTGGESGHGARPLDLAWARSVRDQCKAAGVKCFVKQLGARPHDGCEPDHDPNGADEPRWLRLSDRAGADPSEWPEDLQVQELPAEVK